MAPSTPAITMRLSVKSLTVALVSVVSPAPSTPSVLVSVTSSVPTIVVLPVACCTVKLPAPTLNCAPLNVKLTSSSIAPSTPAITMRLSVKSLTLALASVVSPAPSTPSVLVSVTSSVPVIAVLPSTVKSLSASISPATVIVCSNIVVLVNVFVPVIV